MSMRDKIANAISLIETHNQSVEDPTDKIDVNDFQKRLKKIGGTSEDLLSELKWEDLEKCGLPTLIARKVATIFRKPSTEDRPSARSIEVMTPVELLVNFNPSHLSSLIAKRLKEATQGKKFLVFNNGNINIDISTKLLQEIVKNYPQRDTIIIDGKPCKVYAVGESVGEFVDENPIYQGRPLRPDDTCDQLNRSWSGVPLIVRQLIYICVTKTHDIRVTHEKAHDILDLALASDAEQKIRQRFPKASIALDELIEAGQAPTLKVRLGTQKINDPFYQNKTY